LRFANKFINRTPVVRNRTTIDLNKFGYHCANQLLIIIGTVLVYIMKIIIMKTIFILTTLFLMSLLSTNIKNEKKEKPAENISMPVENIFAEDEMELESWMLTPDSTWNTK